VGVWEQRQIRHAQALGVGLVDPAKLALVTRSLERDPAEFNRLVDEIHRMVGVAPAPS
jgi:hypothetical protein